MFVPEGEWSDTARQPQTPRGVDPSRDTPPMARLVLAAALCALLALPAVAHAKRYDIPAAMGDQLEALVEETPVGVMIPRFLPLDTDRPLFTATSVTEGAWFVELAATRRCGGANACTLGTISGVQGGERTNRVRVRLRDGKSGWYRPLSCGASCAPPSIEFVRAKVLYTIQAKVAQRGKGPKAILTTAANSALKAGLR